MVRMGGATGTRTICPTGGFHGGREQAMISLSRRLQRLEAGCRQNVADRCRIIQQESFKHLSIDQKKCLLAAMTSYQHRPLTSEEGAVVRGPARVSASGPFLPETRVRSCSTAARIS